MSYPMFKRCVLAVLLAATWTCPAWADDTAQILVDLQKQVRELNQKMQEKDQQIQQLQQKVQSLQTPEKTASSQPVTPKPQTRKEALDAALADIEKDQAMRTPAPGSALASAPLSGGAEMKLIDVSLDVLFNMGSSTASNSEIQTLQGGGHDPHNRGFSLGQAELSLSGAIDPYLNGEAHIVFLVDPDTGESATELEEAFATTSSLPWGLQLKGGHFLSKFGLINPVHPHAWDWIDQPIINSRVFGGDGMRQSGVQVSWLTPLPWYSQVFFSVQNATGEQMPSFMAADETIGGRPFEEHNVQSFNDLTYTMRWANQWELSDELSLSLGGSGAYGANAAGGNTWLYGGDAKLKWKPVLNDHGWPFVTWQTEFIGRRYAAAAATHPGTDGVLGTFDDVNLAGDTLKDWGFYTQMLYGFKRNWATGLRYEYVTGSGDSVDQDGTLISHNDDPNRDERYRISPIIQWQPTHFSRFRLQYNFDHAAHLDKDAHTVWLGVEFLYGAHPAHSY